LTEKASVQRSAAGWANCLQTPRLGGRERKASHRGHGVTEDTGRDRKEGDFYRGHRWPGCANHAMGKASHRGHGGHRGGSGLVGRIFCRGYCRPGCQNHAKRGRHRKKGTETMN